MRDPVTIEVARGAAAVGACAPLWEALRAADRDAPPLTGPDYLLPMRETLARQVTPLCIVARRGGAVVGVLPLGRKRVRCGAVRLRRLVPLAGRHAYFTDAILAPDGADETAHALAVAMLAEAQRGDDALLQRIPRERPLGRALAALPGVTVVAEPRNRITPPIALQGRAAQELRRRLRRLAERATSTTVHVEHPDAVRERFLAFAAMHTTMMPQRGLDAVLAAPSARTRVADLMARRAAQGTAGIVEIHVAGRLAASQVWLREGDTYIAYRSTWDVEWTPYSMGLHVIEELVRLVISRSGAAFELGPGQESYKKRWHPTAEETITARVVYPTWRQRVGWWTSRARWSHRTTRGAHRGTLPSGGQPSTPSSRGTRRPRASFETSNHVDVAATISIAASRPSLSKQASQVSSERSPVSRSSSVAVSTARSTSSKQSAPCHSRTASNSSALHPNIS